MDWCWSWSSNTLVTWCEEMSHWERPVAGKDWKQKEKTRMRCLCHQVQVHSACLMKGQWIWETRCWGKEETLIREPADQEDGRLAPQNSHLIGVWMPGCFIDQRERSNEELKSKGRIEREMQWGSKLKGSSVFQNISKGMSSLWEGCVSLFYSQVGRDKLSLHELNKGTLVYSQAKGQGLQASHWVRL